MFDKGKFCDEFESVVSVNGRCQCQPCKDRRAEAVIERDLPTRILKWLALFLMPLSLGLYAGLCLWRFLSLFGSR